MRLIKNIPASVNNFIIAKQHAKAADLVYVTDKQPGIERKKKGKKFIYTFKNKIVVDKVQLERINKLVLPPAWRDVWICTIHNGHLQATGKDARNRKQYKYHADWSTLRNETKFHSMIDFGKSLPKIRAQVKKDLSKPDLTQEKVIATIVSLMEQTHIRIGNQSYEKEYGSHGLTTLKDKHVKINGNELKFSFTGKKGIHHSINLRSKKLARIVKQCRDIPGKELFQYMNSDGTHQVIDSGKVNEYIRNATGNYFTAKDFRTWAGTLHAMQAFKSLGEAETESAAKKNIIEVLDMVSSALGNTRTVCKKYYVNPLLFSLYENKKLSNYLLNGNDVKEHAGLTGEEKILLRILKDHSRQIH